MNPHEKYTVSFLRLFYSLWSNRHLIVLMTKREVVGRYKGSIMGLLWSFLNPVFMLAVYTFVFSEVFKARWSVAGSETKSEFALVLFVGLIVNALFAEVLNRSPYLIVGNANYVKKVVFPLEILPVISVGSALFHSIISLVVLFIAFAIFNGFVPWTAVFTPLVLLPLVVITLGFAWILASLGVFLRDIGQTIGIFTTILSFLAPVFYPVSALPEKYHAYMMINPLTMIIEQARLVLIFGKTPYWTGLFIYTVLAIAIAWFGYAWFQKTRAGFADVI